MEGERIAAFSLPRPRRTFPSTVICSRGNRAWLLMTAPVRRWHSKQWHMAMRTGSPSTVSWSCPQLHAACRVVIGRLRGYRCGASVGRISERCTMAGEIARALPSSARAAKHSGHLRLAEFTGPAEA